MDFYQGVVIDYLRADRAVFVNAECCIQLNEGANPDNCGPHWYCDAVAVDFRNHETFLCEISFEESLGKLKKRLKEWSDHWPELCNALKRDCNVPTDFGVRPWLFVPAGSVDRIVASLEAMKGADGAPLFKTRITPLQKVQPWLFHAWSHMDCMTDKSEVPEAYRS